MSRTEEKQPFPESVKWLVAPMDGSGSISVHPAEERLAEKIRHPGRKELFRAGRALSRRLLQEFGVPDTIPVLRGPRDEPLWPEGIVGSIAHTRGFVAVAVTDKLPLIGIDIELREGKLRSELGKRLCTDMEIARLSSHPETRGEELLKIFSAKEAFYKAIYPRIQRYLGFRDVELTWSDDANAFTGRILQPTSTSEVMVLEGRVHILSQFILSSAWLGR